MSIVAPKKLELRVGLQSSIYYVIEKKSKLPMFTLTKTKKGSNVSPFKIEVAHLTLNSMINRFWGISYWETRLANHLGVERNGSVVFDKKVPVKELLARLTEFVNFIVREGQPED